ncbi:MAG: BatA domain-containing protein [Planctomycetota bacterium]
MSFLYPLFLAGIAVIGVPILLHMIRRNTRKRVPFSSLMFLHTTVPRFKDRSRLENLLLLALRCIMLCLLAFAFSRPFLPQPADEEEAAPGRRIAVLIDTSASMRREGMWAQAVGQARSALDAVSPKDRVCFMSFDREARTLIGFEEWETLDPARRASIVTQHISGLSPGWAPTDLGRALVAAAEAIEDDEINDGRQAVATRQVVVISDMQQGSSLEALQAYEWPENMELEVKVIGSPGPTNAAPQLVMSRDDPAGPDDGTVAVRITNSPDATIERFALNWADDDSVGTAGQAADVYVPAGHSSVVRVPVRTDGSPGGKLVLTGDDHDFDNTLYVAPRFEQQVNILYVGADDANDPHAMLFYVRRALGATRAFNPNIVSRPPAGLTDTDIATAHLIIVTDPTEPEHLAALRRYLESGRVVLLVMQSANAAKALGDLAGVETIQSEEADVDRYAMLGRIEFEHPLLAPFSEPRFGDFTRIHFWKHRRIDLADLPDVEVLARFDSNDPAWLEVHVGKGSLLVLTSGWHPSDSQLALSSKFVPLLYSILEYGGAIAGQKPQYFVGDQVPIPQSLRLGSAGLQVRKPDGSLINLDAGQQTFTQTDLPGIYAIESSAGKQLLAVNLPVKECQTAVMPIEDIERLGVSLRQSAKIPPEQIKQASHHSTVVELELKQKLWRWVLVVLLAVSLIESWLAGWLTRAPSVSRGEER